ncbi:myosin-7-like [Homalodisca vitripennis]|uniref:myosin-7-like n=1 Tax=Homalodisca vitripennis TaxID=197043 RepID=UPI001EECA668|nr:myosin-7-like [Homalodisca vitripennis]XP_046663940.1 myosin-7-like [Homalodisca vitripennis]XP_046663941.1 myosin-7-like [Homalodisca vitripennis]XP_046663942.1 myosin-7-like [Homalodisca vitripennis]XP_046663943.1 myosin-7-like [Homalodisca vitripennis]
MDEGKDPSKQVNTRPESSNSEETLNKIAQLEEKLKALYDFGEQSQKIRETRRKLIENLMNFTGAKTTKSTTVVEKRVRFSGEQDFVRKKELQRELSRQDSYPQILNKTKSVRDLMFHLHTWHGEIRKRKDQIEMLKTKRMGYSEEKAQELDEKIKQLENEKDELDEKVLHFVLHNIDNNKEDYKELITHLEVENKEMEDRMDSLQKRIAFLRETTTALLYENEQLRKDLHHSPSSATLILEKRYRESLMTGARNLDSFSCDVHTTASEELYSLDLENYDDLSSIQRTEDSFELDKKMSTWKTDDESLQKCLRRLSGDQHDMKVIHMKLTMVKQYVQVHGTKSINKYTFIDNSNPKLSLPR